jgi:ABC-type bacteriocin/lantibiotic exporter with double-glycine peptidase domain
MGIILENISYSYGEKPVLKDISLWVAQGERIGIIGESGGGKSTLLKLISGLYELQSGSLSVAGESSPERIRMKVAMVMQANQLFPVSIRDNISCGHVMSEEWIWQACDAAQITDWIATLPDGLDTYVGERGNKVSGGQAQRIAIARAIAKNAPVILLDEAISALDTDTGNALIAALNELTKGRTVLNVSHRREALAGCDRIYRLTEKSLQLIS